ncbi:glu asp-tRNA amidotransferase subunit A [Fusarium pseudocircinatum]|uniref:Glu asp-tRNA amidotransferase subunit A n=1 Tax=Fusarium pseudocircinatum TaxID=56676 RepID=A0A8H5UYC6_9HYPO|nr:glu asp-tRNA amidotransferase subunit A [Fusarium pseudocircinatum]
MTSKAAFNLLEANISDLKKLLDTRVITSVDLVALYLHRIGKYDCRGPCLNSITLINPDVFAEAQASDDHRASGKPPRPLEGIPFTVKDSYKVKGMTVAAASPAFAKLEATSDAAIVELLRKVGAVVLGKTNMPPMADGGCQRGLYGRSESPYNQKYMPTAYASGSSYGCGVSTAASLAAFGFAGESVTSGRSPASNNALVGYAPSRSVIPPRGLWPLYPTCDQVVPHTRTMDDLFHVLNVVTDDDSAGDADFWRSQPYVSVPKVSEIRPVDYLTLANPDALRNKRLAVPRCFIGVEGVKPENACSAGVQALWERARADIEKLGATVIETDFPLFENYTRQDFPGQSMNVPNLPDEWPALERCEMIALSWNSFLRGNGDKDIPSFTTGVELDKIHPHIAPMDDPSQHTESQNQVRYEDMVAAVKSWGDKSLADLPGCREALQALEAMRTKDLEDWMVENNYDAVVFPTNGDVALADSDESYDSMMSALRDGVKYANRGRSLKHLGVPCITVPMGTLVEEKMPVGLSFCGRAYDDSNLLSYAYAYERATKRRESPPLAPSLPSDEIPITPPSPASSTVSAPTLNIASITSVNEDSPESDVRIVKVTGTCHLAGSTESSMVLDVFANGEPTSPVSWTGNNWVWTGRLTRPKRSDKYPPLAKVPRDQFLIVFIAKADNGRSAGYLTLLD